jgi:hypothetical protein
VYGLLQAGIVELVGRPGSAPSVYSQPEGRSSGRARVGASPQDAAPVPRTYVKRGIINRLIERIKRL